MKDGLPVTRQFEKASAALGIDSAIGAQNTEHEAVSSVRDRDLNISLRASALHCILVHISVLA